MKCQNNEKPSYVQNLPSIYGFKAHLLKLKSYFSRNKGWHKFSFEKVFWVFKIIHLFFWSWATPQFPTAKFCKQCIQSKVTIMTWCNIVFYNCKVHSIINILRDKSQSSCSVYRLDYFNVEHIEVKLQFKNLFNSLSLQFSNDS